MQVYIEKVFFDNFALNYILLSVCARFNFKNVKLFRLIISACMGAICAVIVFLIKNPMLNLIVRVCSGVIMCFAAFYYKRNLLNVIKRIVYLLLCSFVFAGVFLCITIFSHDNVSIYNGFVVGNDAVMLVIYALSLMFLFIHIFVRFLTRDRSILQNLLEAVLVVNESNINITGYLDTGNTYVDLLTGLPVVFININKLIGIISDEFMLLVTENNADICGIKEKIYPINYSTISGDKSTFGVKGKLIYKESEYIVLICPVVGKVFESMSVEAIVPRFIFE